MELLLYPHPALRRPADPVGTVTPAVAATAREMLQIMRDRKGIGLAGPQVGYGRRLIVVNVTGKPEDDRVFVDPRVAARRGSEDGEEGCLSFPGLVVRIRRAAWVRVEAASLEGTPVVVETDGLLGRVLQHEIDHLDGLLLTDRMSPAERRVHVGFLREMEENDAASERRRKGGAGSGGGGSRTVPLGE